MVAVNAWMDDPGEPGAPVQGQGKSNLPSPGRAGLDMEHVDEQRSHEDESHSESHSEGQNDLGLGLGLGKFEVDAVQDEFGLLKLIDDDGAGNPSTNSGGSGSGKVSNNTHGASDANGNGSNKNVNVNVNVNVNGVAPGNGLSATPPSPAGSSVHVVTDDESATPTSNLLNWANASPLGFADQYSSEDSSGTPRGKKSRRWTVNIPSLAHFTEDSSKGLFLPPLNEPNNDLATGLTCDSSPGFEVEADYFTESSNTTPAAMDFEQQRKQQLEEMQREEERLKEQLERIQQKKQQVEMGALRGTPPPPPSPQPEPAISSTLLAMPPSPSVGFDDLLSTRRHSHLDTASTWGSSFSGSPPSSSGRPLESTGEVPDYLVDMNQQYSRRLDGTRRHTVTASTLEGNSYNPYFTQMPAPYQDLQMPMQQGHSPNQQQLPHQHQHQLPHQRHQRQQQQQQQQQPSPAMGIYSSPYYTGQTQPQYYQHMPPLNPMGGVSLQSPAHAPPVVKQRTGPPGANLFVFNFPRIFSNADLEKAFTPFGNVLSATVFIDKVTQRSKCFGFVSFDSAEAAQLAITKMNGAQLGGKTIKVQLKRENQGPASQGSGSGSNSNSNSNSNASNSNSNASNSNSNASNSNSNTSPGAPASSDATTTEVPSGSGPDESPSSKNPAQEDNEHVHDTAISA